MPERMLKVRIEGGREELSNFLRDHPLDLNCGGTRRQADGSFVIEAFVPETQMQQLTRARLRIDVMEDASSKGLERQKEVSRENRFSRYQVPRGLGKKI